MVWPKLPKRPTTLVVVMILPLPWAIMWGSTAWVQLKTPLRFTSITRSNCSSVILARVASMVMPALLMSTSIRPQSATTRSAIA
ncbi:hypothetical protein D3C72_2168440 [compost metagenome]